MRLLFSSMLLVSLWGCTRESSPSSIESLRVRSDSALSLLEETMAAPAGSSPSDTIVRIVPFKGEKLVARIKQRVDTVWIRDTVYIVR